ncbi:MAG: DUF5916 domain-containing protein [Bacteroidetes bacterium]|nr:DUF5916 domain-containing protein [Bacteroidota bacterium]
MYSIRKIICIVICLLSLKTIYAQKVLKAVPQYKIHRATTPIKLDGIPDEEVWKTAQVASDFVECYPTDSVFCRINTMVMLTYDDKNLYIAAYCHNKIKGKYVAQSLKRDFSYPKNDAFGIYIDPQNDNANGFNFTVTPLGVQREGIISNGGLQGVTTAWDNKWYSEVHDYDTMWTLEIAIPFKSIRYNSEGKMWGINFSRQDLTQNENTVWSPVPKSYNIASLGYAGKLIWEEGIPKAGLNLSLIPYLRGDYSQDFLHHSPAKTNGTLGLDAKVGITSSLNLDLTLNPDFSQVDVDEQIINLDRFDIFFPEKRTFFQENSDLFDFFGFRKIRPFFSRRIGLTDSGIIPINIGARLSGKIGPNWRIGAMDVQTSGVSKYGLNATNFTVGAIQRKVGAASNIGAILVNKQAFNSNGEQIPNQFNRVACLEYDLYTPSNKWTGKAFYQQSFSPTKNNDAYSHATWLMYRTPAWDLEWNHEFVGRNFKAETGFVPRKGYWRLEPSIGYTFYSKSPNLYSHTPYFYNSIYADRDLSFKSNSHFAIVTDRLTVLSYGFKFRNSAALTFNANDIFTKLTFPFDPTGRGKNKLPIGDYHYTNYNINLNSDFRKAFYAEGYTNYGEYYSGKSFSFGGLMQYRYQPYLALSVRVDHYEITLPAPGRGGALTLISPKAEISFTRNISLTTWLQYNDQKNNVNLNTRLQWRFAPMSDLFIVYNSDYNATDPNNPQLRFRDVSTKGQSIILKATYWLNL